MVAMPSLDFALSGHLPSIARAFVEANTIRCAVRSTIERLLREVAVLGQCHNTSFRGSKPCCHLLPRSALNRAANNWQREENIQCSLPETCGGLGSESFQPDVGERDKTKSRSA
jgi:hypothetical protein